MWASEALDNKGIKEQSTSSRIHPFFVFVCFVFFPPFLEEKDYGESSSTIIERQEEIEEEKGEAITTALSTIAAT